MTTTTKNISGKLRSLVLFPHRNENTFPDLQNLCGSALLISGCLNQKLHGPSRKGLAHKSFVSPAMPWPPTPPLDSGGDVTHLLLGLCFSPSALKPLAVQKICLAFLHLWKCAMWFPKSRKSSLDAWAASWGRGSIVVDVKIGHQIKAQSRFITQLSGVRVKAKPKAGQVCKGCPNSPVALSAAIQPHPTAARVQSFVSPVIAAPAMAWGPLAGRRCPARMGGCIRVGPFRVGQAVFNFLLTLCARLQVGGKKRQHFDTSPTGWPFCAHKHHVWMTISFT